MNQDQAAEVYYEGLYRFAFSLSKCASDASDAADLVQQTFLAWMKHRDGINDLSKVKSWLFTTLYREFLRGLRKQQRMKYLEDEEIENASPDLTEHAGRKLDGAWPWRLCREFPIRIGQP